MIRLMEPYLHQVVQDIVLQDGLRLPVEEVKLQIQLKYQLHRIKRYMPIGISILME